jgi:hypothetical protein
VLVPESFEGRSGGFEVVKAHGEIEVVVVAGLSVDKRIDAPSAVDPEIHTRVVKTSEYLGHLDARGHALRYA